MAGSQGAAGTGFLSKISLAARLLGRASRGPQLGAHGVGWGMGRPRQWLQEKDKEQGFLSSLTQCSHCWTLVIEVLGADLTHCLGIHLLQGEAEASLTDRHQGHLSQSTLPSQPAFFT